MLLALSLVVLAGLVRWAEPHLAFFPFAGEDITPQHHGIAFTPLTITTADGERLRAWHLPRADARAQVVYFHGNGGNLSVWSDVLVGLWRERFDVVAVDYRGYGLSTGRPSEQGLYRDAEATVTYTQSHLRRADLPLLYWGRSLGSTVAAYAAARQAPDGVILEAGFPDVRAVLAGNPVLWLLSVFSTYRFPTAAWMSTVTTPTLVLHGTRDSVIPYRLGERLHDALPGPKRFVAIDGGDHNDPTPADAARYWSAVGDFVAALSAT